MDSCAHESMALQPVEVEGWTLFKGTSGHWVRDLDIGERAEMARPRDVRRVVKTLIEEGSILAETVSALGARDNIAPQFRSVTEVVTFGKGGARDVTTYYLNEAAAIMVLGRLRTEPAIRVTRAVVLVFLAVARGEYVGPGVHELLNRVADLEASRDLDRQEKDILRARVDLLDPASDGLIGKARADRVRHMIMETARATNAARALDSKTEVKLSADAKELDNQLRIHLGFVQGISQGWESLELLKWGKCWAKLKEMLGRAVKHRDRAARQVDDRIAQLDLPSTQRLKSGLVKLPFKETGLPETKKRHR